MRVALLSSRFSLCNVFKMADSAPKRTRGRKAAAAAPPAEAGGDGAAAEPAAKKARAPKSAATEKTVFPRSPTPRAALPAGASTWRAVSWNVAGLRACLASPGARGALSQLVAAEAPDLLCLQEHKLQAQHVAACEAGLRVLLPDYGAYYWAVSSDKAGYSGVVVLLRGGPKTSVVGGAAATPALPAAAEGGGDSVAWGAAGAPVGPPRFGLGASGSHNGEGRCVTVEFERFVAVCAYVPNSGEGLKRLDYRLSTWEAEMRAHARWLAASTSKPVVLGGDLNVAHRDADIYNAGAPHLKKSAGTTPQERAAFGALCSECGLVDTLPAIHPSATGVFSYWSVRAGNKPWNRGLRLDYWLVSRAVAEQSPGAPSLVDAFVVDSVGSDHAPVGVTLLL